MKKKALITGITGQDGAYLAEYLLKLGYVASIAGDREDGKKINLSNPLKAKDFRSDDLAYLK